MTEYSNGDAKWVADAVPVVPGQKYIYRDWYKSTVRTRLTAAFVHADGTKSFLSFAEPPASSEWVEEVYGVTVPSGVLRLSVYHLIAAVGTLQIDDVTLTLPAEPDLSSGVPNGSLEQYPEDDPSRPLAWNTGSWGENTATFTYGNTGRSGTRGVSLVVSDYVNGDAKWYFAPQPVSPGTRLLYSDYYTSTVPSFLTVRLTMANGAFSYINLGELPASMDYAPAFGAFLVPDEAVAATVFHGLAERGELAIDDAAMVVLAPADLVDGVPNGDIEQSAGSSPLPLAWYRNVWGTNTTSFGVENDGHSGAHSLRIDVASYASGAAAWFFDSQPVVANQVYSYGEYYRSDVDTQVSALYTLGDGSQVSTPLPPANASPTAWARYHTSMVAPPNAVRVTVLHMIQKVGHLQLDDVSLLPMQVDAFRRPLVTVTFDDAWLSDYTLAMPILRQLGVHATHYAITGFVGREDRLSLEMLQSLAAEGQEIGSHTVSHADLTTLAEEDMDWELLTSRQYLIDHGIGPGESFAFPFGVYNTAVLARSVSAGYASGRTTDTGLNFKSDIALMQLKVISVFASTSSSEISYWASLAASTRSWLILVYHAVENAPVTSIYSVTPESLQAHLVALQAHGLAFVTMREGVAEVADQLLR